MRRVRITEGHRLQGGSHGDPLVIKARGNV
jgi:hypothetical protein